MEYWVALEFRLFRANRNLESSRSASDFRGFPLNLNYTLRWVLLRFLFQ